MKILICIFININEKNRNERKITEKLRCVPTKLPIYQLLTILILYYKNSTYLTLRQRILTHMDLYAKDLVFIFVNRSENI